MEFQAGRLRASMGTRVAASASSARRLPRDPKAKLPRRFGWLLPLVPCQAAGYALHLRAVLAEPEMQGLLAASAQARRVLAPVCRMLGIEAAVLTPGEGPRNEVPAPVEASEVKSGVVQGEFVISEPIDNAWHVAIHRIRWGGD